MIVFIGRHVDGKVFIRRKVVPGYGHRRGGRIGRIAVLGLDGIQDIRAGTDDNGGCWRIGVAVGR